jgi:hypothetical protein
MAYDAGLLNDYGGGNVEWWQDYIRAELDRSHDYYASEIANLRATNTALIDAVARLTEARDAAFAAGLDAAAEVAEGLAPYTEAAIQKATGAQILDNLVACAESRMARKIAAAIRAMKGATK